MDDDQRQYGRSEKVASLNTEWPSIHGEAELQRRCAALALGHSSWIRRRVESIQFLADGQTRRKISFDFQLRPDMLVPRSVRLPQNPENPSQSLPWHPEADEYVAVPLAFMRKGALGNLDVKDAAGTSLSSVGLGDNGLITRNTLLALMRSAGLAEEMAGREAEGAKWGDASALAVHCLRGTRTAGDAYLSGEPTACRVSSREAFDCLIYSLAGTGRPEDRHWREVWLTQRDQGTLDELRARVFGLMLRFLFDEPDDSQARSRENDDRSRVLSSVEHSLVDSQREFRGNLRKLLGEVWDSPLAAELSLLIAAEPSPSVRQLFCHLVDAIMHTIRDVENNFDVEAHDWSDALRAAIHQRELGSTMGTPLECLVALLLMGGTVCESYAFTALVPAQSCVRRAIVKVSFDTDVGRLLAMETERTGSLESESIVTRILSWARRMWRQHLHPASDYRLIFAAFGAASTHVEIAPTANTWISRLREFLLVDGPDCGGHGDHPDRDAFRDALGFIDPAHYRRIRAVATMNARSKQWQPVGLRHSGDRENWAFEACRGSAEGGEEGASPVADPPMSKGGAMNCHVVSDRVHLDQSSFRHRAVTVMHVQIMPRAQRLVANVVWGWAAVASSLLGLLIFMSFRTQAQQLGDLVAKFLTADNILSILTLLVAIWTANFIVSGRHDVDAETTKAPRRNMVLSISSVTVSMLLVALLTDADGHQRASLGSDVGWEMTLSLSCIVVSGVSLLWALYMCSEVRVAARASRPQQRHAAYDCLFEDGAHWVTPLPVAWLPSPDRGTFMAPEVGQFSETVRHRYGQDMLQAVGRVAEILSQVRDAEVSSNASGHTRPSESARQ